VLAETSHGEIGGWLAEQWHLPEELITGIRHHHDVSAATGHGQRLASVCSFCDFVCLAKGIGSSGSFSEPQLDPEAWGRLSIPKEQLPNFVEILCEELKKSETLLGSAVG